MGADISTANVSQLTDMGFSVEDSRAALQATMGDVARAAELLSARQAQMEREAGGPLAFRINNLLREQRVSDRTIKRRAFALRPGVLRSRARLLASQPWNEFFERFLWPEHLAERVQTNLLYYRGKCVATHASPRHERLCLALMRALPCAHLLAATRSSVQGFAS